HVAFNPAGDVLAVGWTSSRLELRNLADQDQIGQAIEGQDRSGSFGGIGELRFSPDGATLAAGGSLGVQLWDVQTARPVGPRLGTALPEGPKRFTPTWSPDGRTLVVSGGDPPFLIYRVDLHEWRQAACAMAGRSLTDAEWRQYFPDEPDR